MASLKWYINRAKIMNAKEIIHRIKCIRYDKKIQSGYRIKEEEYKINFINLPNFIGCDKENNNLLLNNCDRILDNNIDIFNSTMNLNYSNKFLKDPLSKKLWSDEIYTKVSFRKDNLPGDPKLIWEINKQQYLLDLGLAYQLTKESKYAEKIISEIEEWINQNPEYRGINWTSGLEISLRCLSWMFSLSLIKEYIINNNIYINKILHYIRIKTELIFNKLSLYSSANNHLIGELTLLLYSSYFIECKESNLWRKHSIFMLNQQINNQFYNDGINKEQSVNYQIHTMELYFLCEYILNLNSMSLEEKTLERLKKACYYLDKLSESDGTVFNIGDEDGGHILKLQSQPNNIIDILQFGSLVLKNNNIYKHKNIYTDYKVLMLFGEKYMRFINGAYNNSNTIEDTYIFKNGGMYVKDGFINNIAYKAMFDFGESGMAPLNAHAHCDILSFNLNIAGNPFLVDCGTYKYHKDDQFRDYFRGVKAHNTISINGLNQFEFLGSFMCEKSPRTILEVYRENNIKCSSDMYINQKCKVSREIKFEKENIYIIDTVENYSKNSVSVEIFFNLDSSVKVKKKCNLYRCKLNNYFINIQIDNQCESNIFKGNYEKKKLGWQSPKYYSIEKTNTIVCHDKIDAKSKKEIITVIYCEDSNLSN